MKRGCGCAEEPHLNSNRERRCRFFMMMGFVEAPSEAGLAIRPRFVVVLNSIDTDVSAPRSLGLSSAIRAAHASVE